MLAQLEQDRWHGRHTGQMGLLAAKPTTPMPELTLQERADWERQVLGLPVSVHPLQLAAKELDRHTLTRSDELDRHAGQAVVLAGGATGRASLYGQTRGDAVGGHGR